MVMCHVIALKKRKLGFNLTNHVTLRNSNFRKFRRPFFVTTTPQRRVLPYPRNGLNTGTPDVPFMYGFTVVQDTSSVSSIAITSCLSANGTGYGCRRKTILFRREDIPHTVWYRKCKRGGFTASWTATRVRIVEKT